ncbi:MAG: TOBE domain-containing protein [Planctomycetes bacterium]|nr:TOBE domain-containing protein [Planctomycetota bacterium]
MKYGARNKVIGQVTRIRKGAVMAQVDVRVEGPIDLSSVLTMDSLSELKLKKGDKVRVVVKAVNVLLVRE